MIPSEGLLALIRRFEGLRLRAYLCPAGVWTIGYGATGSGIGPGLTWTAAQAEERLHRDTPIYIAAAAKLCPGATGSRLDALADFAYNLGATRLAGSTLRRRFNRGDFEGAAAEFSKWVFGGGRKLPGLVLRREAERQLFLS